MLKWTTCKNTWVMQAKTAKELNTTNRGECLWRLSMLRKESASLMKYLWKVPNVRCNKKIIINM